MKYEFDILAAIVQLQYPSVHKIVNATGISERKVQLVLNELQSLLGVQIEKRKNGNKFYYDIISWGAFESGAFLKQKLQKLNLLQAKSSRLSKKKQHKLDSLDEKIAHFDKQKLKNYKESMRLEGIESTTDTIALSVEKVAEKKQELLNFYKNIKANR